jgi:hypothetical protein
MTHWYEEYGEFDETPDEFPEEIPEEYLKEENSKFFDLKETDIPDEWWVESIKGIENPQIREKEIEVAQKILERQKRLDEKLEAGEISKSRYDHENLVRLGRQKAKFSTRCDLESVGLTYDHLEDLVEDFDLIVAEAGGNPKPAKMKDQLKEAVHHQGPEVHQQLADEMLEEGKLTPEKGYKTVSRTAKLSKK